MARRITPEALALLKQWEGLVLHTYDDRDTARPPRPLPPGQKAKGKATIGYGHTGAYAVAGNTITEAKANELLLADLRPCEAAVERAITVPLTNNQFAALVSFAFNLGESLEPGKPLANIALTLNKGDFPGALRRMGLYIKSRDAEGVRHVNLGLVNRRAAEAGLWARGEFVSSRGITASSPAATIAGAATETKTGHAAIGAVLGSVAAAAAGAAPAIEALGRLAPAVAVAIVVAAAVVVVLLRRGREATA